MALPLRAGLKKLRVVDFITCALESALQFTNKIVNERCFLPKKEVIWEGS